MVTSGQPLGQRAHQCAFQLRFLFNLQRCSRWRRRLFPRWSVRQALDQQRQPRQQHLLEHQRPVVPRMELPRYPPKRYEDRLSKGLVPRWRRDVGNLCPMKQDDAHLKPLSLLKRYQTVLTHKILISELIILNSSSFRYSAWSVRQPISKLNTSLE